MEMLTFEGSIQMAPDSPICRPKERFTSTAGQTTYSRDPKSETETDEALDEQKSHRRGCIVGRKMCKPNRTYKKRMKC